MKVEGEDNHLTLWPLLDNNKATKNYIVVIYDDGIKYQGEILCTKTQGNNLRETWLLFVNVIQKFRKAVQMCV
jgi:hypothetical protein